MYKFFILFFAAQTCFAANDIRFQTELSGEQLKEQVKISIDGKEVCELNAKSAFFGLLSSADNCSFQPTKKVHRYKISGKLKIAEEKNLYHGIGEGFIVNYFNEYEKLKTANNLNQLFEYYNEGITAINKELPKNNRIKLINFAHKETHESVNKHIRDHEIVLPNDYIKMITQYGYPQNIDTFIPISQQNSIADVYLDDYEYPIEYLPTHVGVEKNLALYNDNDVYYVFHNQTAQFCGEPMIDYTIMTEGDYSPIAVANLTTKDKCGSFFEFLKNQMTENFIDNISSSFDDSYVLPVYKNTTLKANLSYNWGDEDNTVEYYFEYNDIFY